jgi:hypothetical protein
MPVRTERKLVTRDELNDILTREIRQINELKDATLTANYILEEPDSTGCNWSGPHLVPGSSASFDYAAPHVQRIIASARSRYNIRG